MRSTFDASACASADASGVLRVETGTGVLPSGLEMCIKLMVPGEVSEIDCKAQHAYDGPHDPSMLTSSVPQGMDVVWRVTLVSFDKPIDLGSPEVASEEAMEEARRRKALGNDLFRSGKVALAKAKYEGLLRDVRRVCGVMCCDGHGGCDGFDDSNGCNACDGFNGCDGE